MNTCNLKECLDMQYSRLSQEQQAVGEYNVSMGFEPFIESYSDYTYLVLVKEGTRNGIKRINKTGHNVYV